MSTADQLNAIAADLRVQAASLDSIAAGMGGSTPVPPQPPGPPAQGTLPRGQQIACTAADNVYTFVAHAGTCEFVTAASPGFGTPPPGNTGSMTITDVNGGVIVGPEQFDNGYSQGQIRASALTDGDTYLLRVQRPQPGGAYARYV